ncbi:S-layer homology domain-containing protein [Paenibacillus sedimenti]|uniref:S-layer homology domain-containing protein n=1 Tax=Paenibacillus sedimenti TaxID=2770274 RepID=A0A926QMN9_9BACL|nr:S-layer homology domain-containing protein [Paenibacillus sedimenti]MBD0384850.1 S-layer homology domain-containing protein [Paenibacillus sedimenti]
MKKLSKVLLAASMIYGSFSATAAADVAGAPNFNDISGHWAEDVITRAHDLKLIVGYEEGTFKPNGEITRAEFAAMLSRATDLPVKTGGNPFYDMTGHWAEAAVTQLVDQGFINPSDYSTGFNPYAQLTRYEMMNWISNGLMKSNETFIQAFEDTKNTLLPTPEAIRSEISSDKVPYIALARGTGIIGGFEDGSVKPQNTTTRAEVAAILLRYKDVEGKTADSYSDLNELREVGLTGANATSISPYRYQQISEKDESGRIKKEYLSFIGIYLNDHTDYKAMETFLQNPDVVIRYHDGKDPGTERFEKFSTLNMSLRDVAFKAMNAGEIVYMGLQNPKNISDEEMNRYMADSNVHLKVDKSIIPYTNFSNVKDQPIQMGDVAELQVHRLLLIPTGEIARQGAVSVYTSLFKADELIEGNNDYMVLYESTLHIKKDTNLLALLNAQGKALGNPLFGRLQRFNKEMNSKSELPVIPQIPGDFFKQGAVNRFWSYEPSPYDSIWVATDSGAYFKLSRP